MNAKKQILAMCTGKEVCGVHLNGEMGRGGGTGTYQRSLFVSLHVVGAKQGLVSWQKLPQTRLREEQTPGKV